MGTDMDDGFRDEPSEGPRVGNSGFRDVKCDALVLASYGTSRLCENITLAGSRFCKDHEPHEKLDHPSHYGGKDNVYEAIKIIEALNLSFHRGNALKYLIRAGNKQGSDKSTDLKKAIWYIQREIDNAG